MFLMRSTESQDVSMFFAERPVCLGALGPWGLEWDWIRVGEGLTLGINSGALGAELGSLGA